MQRKLHRVNCPELSSGQFFIVFSFNNSYFLNIRIDAVKMHL